MKLLLNGKSVEAKSVPVVKSEERMNEYLLADGTMVKVRTILTGVYRYADKVDQNGQPLYHLNWHVIPTTEPPE